MTQIPGPETAYIHPTAVMGRNVTVATGAQVWANTTIEDGVVIGPLSVVGYMAEDTPNANPTVIGAGARIGARCIIYPGVSIGKGAHIQSGAIVTKKVPDYAIICGQTNTIIGYTAERTYSQSTANGFNHQVRFTDNIYRSKVRGVELRSLNNVLDMRGNLTTAQFPGSLPFVPQRYFMVYEVPNKEIRGEHAHKTCAQFLVCVHGRIKVEVTDNNAAEVFELDVPYLGLYIPPLIWTSHYEYHAQSQLLVLASEIYRESDYIRTFEEYKQAVANRPATAPHETAVIYSATRPV